MHKTSAYILLALICLINFSCTEDNDSDIIENNLEELARCELLLTPDTLNSICVDGAKLAAPGEIISLTSSFFSRLDDPNDTEFIWTIASGNMEVLEIETAVEDTIATSVAVIRVDSDFTGNAVVRVNAKNQLGEASMGHNITIE